MVTLTVAINLPVWRQAKTNPRIAEAQAMYEQVRSLATNAGSIGGGFFTYRSWKGAFGS